MAMKRTINSITPVRRNGRRGFTLIEIMVVIAIIVLLAGITLAVGAMVKKNAAIKNTRAAADTQADDDALPGKCAWHFRRPGWMFRSRPFRPRPMM